MPLPQPEWYEWIQPREKTMLETTLTRRTFILSSAALLTMQPEEIIRFGVVADLHYADRPPSGTRYYQLSLRKLANVIRLMQSRQADFLVELGDFKDQDEPPHESTTLAYLRSVEEVFTTFPGPRYHVLGNHDLDSISRQQFQQATSNTGIDSRKTHYSFDRGGYRFIVLDANYRSDMVPYERGNFDWRDSNLPPEQLSWLEDQLKGSAPAIVFIHQRLDEQDGDVPSVLNRLEARRILERSGRVLLVLQGHAHPGASQQINGIHYLTIPALVEENDPEDVTSAIVTLHPGGKIEVTGFGRAAALSV